MNGYSNNITGLYDLTSRKIEIILLQETHNIWGHSIKQSGYTCYESNDASEPKRGVAILLLNGIFDKVTTDTRNKGSELYLKARFNKMSLLIGSVHLVFQEAKFQLKELADFISNRSESVIIVGGDMNVDCSADELQAIKRQEILSGQHSGQISDFLRTSSLNMGKYFGDPTTKYHHVYDYIFTNMKSKIDMTTVMNIYSDHLAVLMHLDIYHLNKKIIKCIPSNVFSKHGASIIQRLNSLVFNEDYLPKSLEEAQSWHSEVETIVEEETKFCLVSTCWSMVPPDRRTGFWFTGNLKKLWKEKQNAQTQYLHDHSDTNREIWIEKKLSFDKLFYQYRRNRYQSMIDDLNLNRIRDPRQFYKICYQLNGKFRSFERIGAIKLNDDLVYGDEAVKAVSNHLMSAVQPRKDWHNSEFLSRIDHKVELERLQDKNYINPTIWNHLISNVTPEEVSIAIMRCSLNKAPGRDGWRPELLRLFNDSEDINKFIAVEFSFIILSGEIPIEWRKTRIVPLPKKGDLELAKNWRGISLISVMYKLFASIIAARLKYQLISRDLLSPEQHGFLPQRSTIEACGVLSEVLLQRRPTCTHMFFLDISQAFDSVHPATLNLTLNRFKIPQNMISLIVDIYSNYQATIVDTIDEDTEWQYASCGVRQGCTLAPLLFIMVIDDLIQQLSKLPGISVPAMSDFTISSQGIVRNEISQLWYADDAVFLAKDYKGLQEKIDLANQWLIEHGMRMNIEKSYTMISGCCKEKSKKLEHKLADKSFAYVESFKYLGLNVHKQRLIKNMASARSLDCNKAIGICASAFMKNSYISPLARIQFIQAIVSSVALYGCEIWASNNVALTSITNKLAKMIKQCLGVSPNTLTFIALLESNIGFPILTARIRQIKFLYNLYHSNLQNRWACVLVKTIKFETKGWMHEVHNWAVETSTLTLH